MRVFDFEVIRVLFAAFALLFIADLNLVLFT